jgi:hypothetical protein
MVCHFKIPHRTKWPFTALNNHNKCHQYNYLLHTCSIKLRISVAQDHHQARYKNVYKKLNINRYITHVTLLIAISTQWNVTFWPFMSKWENTVPGIKFSQWLKGKTLSCNIMSCLRFSAFIIIHLVFTIFVLGLYCISKRIMWNLILVKIITKEV